MHRQHNLHVIAFLEPAASTIRIRGVVIGSHGGGINSVLQNLWIQGLVTGVLIDRSSKRIAFASQNLVSSTQRQTYVCWRARPSRCQPPKSHV